MELKTVDGDDLVAGLEAGALGAGLPPVTLSTLMGPWIHAGMRPTVMMSSGPNSVLGGR